MKQLMLKILNGKISNSYFSLIINFFYIFCHFRRKMNQGASKRFTCTSEIVIKFCSLDKFLIEAHIPRNYDSNQYCSKDFHWFH
ncbi:hypothetical protein BpHYR1_030811 [Brachionus plicatilis]|uniref:Uncharacterized protein n=1 Tax=Brachionus plicatilis TaxID=10195 RepID=A0A3M7PBK3_BRAPC|nr:hypothetical protein BpHYR1_030811 [Brachionus plicatilis]